MHRVELKEVVRRLVIVSFFVFLMHRVELKVELWGNVKMIVIPVPNAPCGVERYKYYHLKREKEKFLMHRVELKVYFLRQVNFYETGS